MKKYLYHMKGEPKYLVFANSMLEADDLLKNSEKVNPMAFGVTPGVNESNIAYIEGVKKEVKTIIGRVAESGRLHQS